MRGKLKNFKVQLLRSNALFLCRHKDTSSLRLFSDEIRLQISQEPTSGRRVKEI